MEEADVLADKIVIMSQGSISCVDNPISLKNRFSGYILRFIIDIETLDHFSQCFENTSSNNFIQFQVGKFTVEDRKDDNVAISFHLNTYEDLSRFLKEVEDQGISISELTVNQTSLEDVFMKVLPS